MKRIAQVVLNAEGTVGGEQRHVLQLITGLDPERFEADVVTWDIPAFVDELEEHGVRTLAVTSEHILDRELVRRLEDEFRRGDYDIVHAHGHRAGLLGRVAALRAGVPHIVWTCHLAENKADRNPLLGWGYRRVLRWLDARTDATVAVSEHLGEWLATQGGDAARRVIIPNGIDGAVFAPGPRDSALLESLGLDPAAPVIGSVARLTEQKGVDTLIAAAARVAEASPGVQFVLVGAGPLEAQLKSQAAETGARIVFAGERHDVPELLRSFDIAVVPSRWEGAFCFTVLEAMATGRPVVCSDIPLFTDVVTSGEHAMVFPAGDAEALAEAVVALLDDTEEAARIAEASRRLVRERFTVERMRASMSALYEKLVREERS